MAGWLIEAQGDTSIIIRLGKGLDIETCRRCAQVAEQLRRAKLPAVSDIVPAFNSITLHVDPLQTATESVPASLLDSLHDLVAAAMAQPLPAQPARTIDIPVCYGGAYGPDLSALAHDCGLSEDAVIEAHSAAPAWVLMLGFAPGAPYIGVHGPLFDVPRRATPRTLVPRGSVAVAARQSVIYPQDSPGGWHIIGRTPLRMFDPMRTPAALLAPGDRLRFVPITAETYAQSGGSA
jgi:KipI family sensor histidine kinase inhibitor